MRRTARPLLYPAAEDKKNPHPSTANNISSAHLVTKMCFLYRWLYSEEPLTANVFPVDASDGQRSIDSETTHGQRSIDSETTQVVRSWTVAVCREYACAACSSSSDQSDLPSQTHLRSRSWQLRRVSLDVFLRFACSGNFIWTKTQFFSSLHQR
ncbi:hypothetical protein COP1_006597 [Malus domestica]